MIRWTKYKCDKYYLWFINGQGAPIKINFEFEGNLLDLMDQKPYPSFEIIRTIDYYNWIELSSDLLL